MEQAFAENKELVFFVSENRKPDSKAKATLAVTISQKDQNAGRSFGGGGGAFQRQPQAPTGGGGFTQTARQPRQAPKSTAPTKENPPKDDLEKFLEDFDK